MFKKLVDAASEVFTWVGISLLALMVLVVCYTVLTRYFFDFTPAWGEVFALLCMLWFGFLSIALGVRDDLHLSLDIIERFLPQPLVKPLNIFKYIVIFGCGVFMVYQGCIMVRVGMWNDLPGIPLSSAWMYLEVPVAGAAILCYCILALKALIRSDNESAS